jgi:hypothetical protein
MPAGLRQPQRQVISTAVVDHRDFKAKAFEAALQRGARSSTIPI